MKSNKTQLALGAALLGAFAGIWRWHSPAAKKLTHEEIDRYLAIISKLPLPGTEAEKFATQLRPWAEADDGKPTFMVNLNRYFPELRRWPGTPQFDGTPKEAQARYQKGLTSKWLRNACYPMVSGTAQGQPLMTTEPDRQNWSNASFVRYPSRRKFLELIAQPAYAQIEPYKFMALEEDLLPVSGDRVIPDFRWIAGGSLLAVFLGVGWSRAARR